VTVPNDWWKDFFSGVVLETWRRFTPEEHTRAEVDFIEKELGLRPSAQVLDVPCGGGRHSLELARRGYRPTGVDLASGFIAEAQDRSAKQGLAVTWENREMRDLPWAEQFDGVFSFGNSFGYLHDAGNRDFLKAVHRTLRPGAKLLLDVPSLAESLLAKFEERQWYPAGDILFLIEQHYDPLRGRMDTEYTFVQNGKVEKRPASHRVYTCRELLGLLEETGFGDVTVYGSLNREPFQLGSPRPMVVTAKQ
jgi:SAM-dependent methyltransferase